MNLCWMIALCFILTSIGAFAAPEEVASDRSSQMPAFVPGELLVKFRAEVREGAARDYQEWFDISTRKTFAFNGYQHVKLPEGVDLEEALELYLEDPDVEHAEPNYYVHANETTPNDAEFTRLWGLHNTGQNVNGTNGTGDADIDAPEAWDVTTGSNDVVVAVIDSGVDINHPDLAANIWVNEAELSGDPGVDDDGNGYVDDVNGWDFYVNDNDPRDAHGHGTHVAGTVAAAGNNGIGITGVSWSAKIMALRFMDAWGNGATDDAISAIEYATAMGADIINNSWGYSTYTPSQALKDAIDASGAVVVCAAGNEGRNTDTSIPHYPSGYASANIISVAASNQNDNRASFSNYGRFSVDVAAPGTNIYSTAPGRETVWEDDFEINRGWSAGGSNTNWARTNEEANSGSYSLTDSPGANYLNDTNSWARSPAINLSNRTAAQLEFKIYGNTEAMYDGMWVEASSNGSIWSPVNLQLLGNPTIGTGVTGEFSSWTTVVADLEGYDNRNTVYVRFRLTSDDIEVRDGYYIDDVKVTAASSSYSGDEYIFKHGTSMATPHVAGLAALIKAQNPALTSTEIKAVILGRVDVKAAWTNLVSTGGRINAASALAAPQISNVQVSSITESTAVITWTTDIPSDSVVQYGTASSTWDNYQHSLTDSALVTSHSVTLSGLNQAIHYFFSVGSTDTYGNGPDNRDDDNPSAEGEFTTANPDPPSIVEFPVINFAADTITVTYDEPDMQGAATEGNYSFSPSMNFATVNPDNDDIADLGGSVYRLSMASIPAYEVFTLTVSNIEDLAGNDVDPASIRINDKDNDNMADDWEIANGLNPAVNDSAGDPDGDGYTNFQEYEARTHPRSAADSPFNVRDSIPGHNAGITTGQRVPNDTDFAVLLESAHGINTTIDNSVQFTINDGVNGSYNRDLGHATMRFVKLTADPDNRVTRMWVVYERSQESGGLQNFPYDRNVNIRVDASDIMANDMIQASIVFNVETEDEHDNAMGPANLPDSGAIVGVDPDVGVLEDGIRVNSGELENAKVIYDSSEQRTPFFGPLNEIPPLNVSGAGAIGAPMNLLPHTVFENPIRVFIACPGYADVGELSVYYYNGSNWARASDAAGNVLAGGDGWMVPGSRVDHNETDPPTIEIQVYHFSGAQAGTFSAGGGGGGGGGGCFISTAAYDSVLKHLLFYVLLNLALIGLGSYTLKKIIRKQ